MTVKVVETKPDASVVKRKVCGNCGATLEYVPNDVRSIHGTDYSGGADGCEYITCPNCKKRVTLRSW
mgnify:CR=1 FL=1